MADTKISDLSAVTDVLSTDEYVLARAGATKKIDASDLIIGITGGASHLTHESRSSNTILAGGDGGKFISITAAITQTFTAAATLTAGWYVWLKNDTTDGTTVLTLDPNSSEQIDGLTTARMYSGEIRLVVCTGTGFVSKMIQGGYAKFTADGTFYVPHGITKAVVECVGGGGGGGNGRSGAGGLGWAGSGGGGGCRTSTIITPARLGAGGTGITVDIGNGGAAETIGDPTKFGTLCYAYGGGHGSVTSSGSTGNRYGAGGGGWGAAGSSSGTDQTSQVVGGNSDAYNRVFGASGAGSALPADWGGGGGGTINGNSNAAGGAGGTSLHGGGGGGAGGDAYTGTGGAQAGGAGGSLGGTPGTGGGGAAGAATAAGTTGAYGCGGGGGGGSTSGNGGAGGAGGPAGGGGGGGGGSQNNTGGTGGTGGNGECLIWYS